MPTYQKMWEFMSGPMKEEVMVSGNGEGIEKVVNDDGGYAFMMESSSIQVHILLTPHKPECKKTVRGVWRPVIIGSPRLQHFLCFLELSSFSTEEHQTFHFFPTFRRFLSPKCRVFF